MVTCGSQPVFFNTENEMEMMNEMKFEVGESRMLVGLNCENGKKPVKTPPPQENLDIACQNCPPDNTGTRTREPSRDRRTPGRYTLFKYKIQRTSIEIFNYEVLYSLIAIKPQNNLAIHN